MSVSEASALKFGVLCSRVLCVCQVSECYLSFVAVCVSTASVTVLRFPSGRITGQV